MKVVLKLSLNDSLINVLRTHVNWTLEQIFFMICIILVTEWHITI